MYIWSVSSAARIMKSSRQDRTDPPFLTLHSGRNMTASGQLVLREFCDFQVTGVSVEAPAGVTAEWHFAEDILFNDGTPYPDILSDKSEITVKAHTAQSIYVTFRVSPDAVPGSYGIPVTAHTSVGDLTVNWTLIIHKVTLPTPAESDFGHEYFFNLSLDPQYDAPRYSERWWHLMKEIAIKMKDLRVNSLNFPVISLLADGNSKRTDKDTWEFDFSRVDEFVEFFLQHGSFSQLTPNAMLSSVSGLHHQIIDEQGKIQTVDSMSEDSEAWIAAYATALYKHFSEKRWLSMLCMRLEDEPHTKEYWLWFRERVRKYMPGVRCGEPIDTHEVGRELGGACDQYVAHLPVYERGIDFYKTRQAMGDEIWVYSCCYPEEPWYLNKFIDLPHAYSRMLKWACFTYGITGFLHWGFNYWNIPLYGLNADARFKGDGFIVYPNPEKNDLLLSVRGLATREGIEDYELLHLLEKKYGELSKNISRRIAKTFTDFTYDPTGRLLDEARAEILTLLDN